MGSDHSQHMLAWLDSAGLHYRLGGSNKKASRLQTEADLGGDHWPAILQKRVEHQSLSSQPVLTGDAVSCCLLGDHPMALQPQSYQRELTGAGSVGLRWPAALRGADFAGPRSLLYSQTHMKHQSTPSQHVRTGDAVSCCLKKLTDHLVMRQRQSYQRALTEGAVLCCLDSKDHPVGLQR